MNRPVLTLGLLAVLAGCVGPNYETRSIDQVLSQNSVAEDCRPGALPALSDAEAPQVDAWWGRFGDEPLERLLAKAYANNRTLASARANLAAARAAWEYQRGALWPSLSVGGDVTRSRTSENGLSGVSRKSTDYNLAATARWELDLFGRQQHQVDAAAAQAEASEANLKAMWVSVSSGVATYYLELRTLQGRLMVAEDNLLLQQSNYGLLDARNRAGITNELIKNQAEYDLRNTAASIPSLRARIVAVENSLAILCGVTPGTLPPEIVDPPRRRPRPVDLLSSKNLADLPAADEQARQMPQGLRPTGIPQPEILTLERGIPADAIRRRPDVIAAERLLKASADLTAAAKAERYPSVYIAGNIGFDSITLGDLLDWDSRFYNFGPGISLPIFRGGQIVANIDIKTEQQKAALAEYEGVVLSALGDIRTALAGYTGEQERLAQLRLGVEAARNAYEIAANKYDAGLGDFFDVLDAQRQLFALDESRVISEGASAQCQVNLYKALCGGWEGLETPETAETLFGDKAVPEPLLAPMADLDE